MSGVILTLLAVPPIGDGSTTGSYRDIHQVVIPKLANQEPLTSTMHAPVLEPTEHALNSEQSGCIVPVVDCRKRTFRCADEQSSSANDDTGLKRQRITSPTRTPSPGPAPGNLSYILSLTPTKKRLRPNGSASSTITMDMLRPHFEKPLAQVAKHFGICVTLLKKICRKLGIARWPHRQITGLRKSIASMEHAIGYFEGERKESYAEQLQKQKSKLEALLYDPTRFNSSAGSDDDTQEATHETRTEGSHATQSSVLNGSQSRPSNVPIQSFHNTTVQQHYFHYVPSTTSYYRVEKDEMGVRNLPPVRFPYAQKPTPVLPPLSSLLARPLPPLRR